MTTRCFAFPGTESLTDHLVGILGGERGALGWRHFPDRESLVTLDGDCRNRDVILVCTFHDPDPVALPLLFAARTAREFGARSVGLVAPYLAYMRQDTRFHSGEAVSSTHFGAFLSSAVDWLATVDPHLHRLSDLGGLFTIPARHVSAMPLVADWIRAEVPEPVLIGPDSESAQWLRQLGDRVGAPTLVLEKLRHGDRDVEVSTPDAKLLEGRTPVLVDDIVSSGRTFVETLARLRALASLPAVCIAVHGIFADESDQALRRAGAARVVSSNTIAHATNAIDVAPVLEPLVRQLLAGTIKGAQ